MRHVDLKKIKMILRLLFRPGHVRIVALLLTGFHIVVVSHLIVRDLAFTVICGMLYVLATVLERVPLSRPLWLLRWAVIVFVALFIGSDLADAQVMNEITEVSGAAVTRPEARLLVTSVLLTFELLAAAFHRQSEHPHLYNGSRSIPPGKKLLIPFEVPSPGATARIDVRSHHPTANFQVRLFDSCLKWGRALNQIGGYAAGESKLSSGRYFVVINNKDKIATLKVEITISLVAKTEESDDDRA